MSQRIKADPKTWSSPTPTEPVVISRVPIYAPVSRLAPNGNRSESGRRSETSWGWVEMSGPVLTWEHRRILLLSKTRAKAEKRWEDGGGTIDQVLCLLRNDLRKELGLSLIEEPPIVFRFVRELDSGDWQGNVVSRTKPVRSKKNSQC